MFEGPAPESVTSMIYEITKDINEYFTCPDIYCEISALGTHMFQVGMQA